MQVNFIDLMTKKETILTISDRTGFSTSTVSRVLSGQAKKYRISDKTIAIITKEARECNYMPSMVAKSLRTNITRTIGLVVPSIDNPFFANIASLIVSNAKANDYTVILADSLENEVDEKEVIRSLLSYNVDGIIIVPSGTDPSHLELLNGAGTPVVLIDRFFVNSSLPYVTTDNTKGATDATRYLINNNHKNIACIQGVVHSTPGQERVSGYVTTMKEYGLESYIKIVGDSFSIENGYVETKILLSSSTPPTAIFALSNTILLGTLKAINESTYKIPHDISLISFDDYTYLDFMNPPITRVSQPIEEICSIALIMLLQSMESKVQSKEKLKLPPKLLVRSSVIKIDEKNICTISNNF